MGGYPSGITSQGEQGGAGMERRPRGVSGSGRDLSIVVLGLGFVWNGFRIGIHLEWFWDWDLSMSSVPEQGQSIETPGISRLGDVVTKIPFSFL